MINKTYRNNVEAIFDMLPEDPITLFLTQEVIMLQITCSMVSKQIRPRSKQWLWSLGSYCEFISHCHQQRHSHSQAATAALYIHWPYCKRRCSYCNFNKYISKSVDHERMKRCLVQETETLLQLSGVEKVTSVFFGGGTPSLAEPSTFEAVLSCVAKLVDVEADMEISMEINPTTLEEQRLCEFRDAGINRVSLGIQTLDQRGLDILGREHSADDSLRALATATHLFPGRVSLDLIYGWPEQTLEGWLEELKLISASCDNHISVYQLTLERGTPLHQQVHSSQCQRLPDVSVRDDMYLEALKILSQAGFERYEVSNFARKKSYSLHNLAYWTGQQYIGIGPGAHGRFTPKDTGQREARIQTLEPNHWMRDVEQYGHGTRKSSPLSVMEQLEELLIMGLRTQWGITPEMWTSISPNSQLHDVIGMSEVTESYITEGLICLDTQGLRATPEGLNVLDSVLADLLLVLERNTHHVLGNSCNKRVTE